MKKSSDILALLGRIGLAAIFVWSGSDKITAFGRTAGYIAGKGLPMPAVLTAITIFVELGLGLAIVIGWRTRIAALLIALWLVPTSFLFHNFWAAPAAQAMMEQVNFMKNVSIFGGMLLLIAFGPGRYSVDGGRG